MTRELFVVTILITILLSACVPATEAPVGIISFTDTPTLTSTWTQTFTITPTASETPTSTFTPIHFQEGRFRMIGPQDYYSDPSLGKSVGRWSDSFFVCTRYYFKDYDSYEIAAAEVDCINRNTLGWVSTNSVILGTGRYDGFSTAPPPDARQCEDGLDNDLDMDIDYPADQQCGDPLGNVERATLVATWTPLPLEKISVSAAPSNLVCAVGDDCPVSVTIRRENPTPNSICVYVQPRETPGQRYYFQFRKDGDVVKGKAFIGPAPDGTKFVIYAVSVPNSSSCPQGNAGVTGLPSGRTGEATITRFKPK